MREATETHRLRALHFPLIKMEGHAPSCAISNWTDATPRGPPSSGMGFHLISIGWKPMPLRTTEEQPVP